MGILSQEGHLGLRIQESRGAYSSPGDPLAADNIFMRTRGGAIAGARELLAPDPEIGGNRDIPGAALGPIAFSGEYDFYVRPRSLQLLLASVLGGWITDTSSDVALVQMWGESTLPWVSIEERIGGSFGTFGYFDAKVNTLHLECDAEGLATGTTGIIATLGNEVPPTPLEDQRRDGGEIVTGVNSVITLGGLQLHPKSVTFDINNNMEDDDFRLGSLYLGGLTERRREVTMSVTVRPDDASMWRQATWGSVGAVAPQGWPTVVQDLTWTMTTSETFDSGSSTAPWTVEITLRNAIMEPFRVDPSGDDALEHEIVFRMVRPDHLQDGIVATATDHPAQVVVIGMRPVVHFFGDPSEGFVLGVDGTHYLGV